MDQELADIEARLSVVEILLAFQFAPQHMQTSDPSAARRRLKSLLLDRTDPPGGDRAAVSAAMERAVQRIIELQESLPRRLVD